MYSQTSGSCAKAFDNRSRSKNLKSKKSRGVNLTPPPPRLLGLINPRSLLEKIVTRSLEGGQSDPPSTFDTIHPIDFKFGTYNKLYLYFQLSKTTWCLIRFHGNNSQINDVTVGRHLEFSNFQILFKFSLLYSD